MRNIFLITHPEATHAVDNLVGGRFDSSLTEQGMESAGKIAAHLKSLPIDWGSVQLRTSDLRRTRQTAGFIANAFNLTAVEDPDLRERSYGVAEGTRPGTLPFHPIPLTGNRLDHFPGTEGTETRRQWATRAYRAMETVVNSEARDFVVVTHGGTLSYLIAAWIGMPLESASYVKFTSTPGGITHLRLEVHDNDRQVVSLNSTDHLR